MFTKYGNESSIGIIIDVHGEHWCIMPVFTVYILCLLVVYDILYYYHLSMCIGMFKININNYSYIIEYIPNFRLDKRYIIILYKTRM